MYQSAYTKDERLENEYIKAYGEKMAHTIAETWADPDNLVLHESHNRERRREVIVGAIVAALEANMSELEIAETAAAQVGNPDFEMYVEMRS